MQAIGTSSAFAVSYRTTNGGTTVTLPYVWAGNNSTATAGNRVYALGVSGAAHEGLNFCVGNGTRYISVASIDMTVHDTTAGSEDASLSFYTMAAGALRVENMRISNLGSVVVGAQAALATGATHDGFLVYTYLRRNTNRSTNSVHRKSCYDLRHNQ